jgi:hypothetical protein
VLNFAAPFYRKAHLTLFNIWQSLLPNEKLSEGFSKALIKNQSKHGELSANLHSAKPNLASMLSTFSACSACHCSSDMEPSFWARFWAMS